jgi:CBS domain-containing protein
MAAVISAKPSSAHDLPPFFLSPDHSAFDAAIAMTERHIAHVCLVKDQRLCGVVSERDLFSLQRVDLVHLARTIRSAQRMEQLVSLRGEIGQLVERMLAHGASSTQITHIITLLNDHTVCRVIELTLAEKGDPGVPFSWLCFGSEGRREQTLHTDQDNGILFEARDAAQAAEIRGKLLPIAQQINQSLAQCGFSLCKGNIMAGNPELCLSGQNGRGALQRSSARRRRRTCSVRASISTCGWSGATSKAANNCAADSRSGRRQPFVPAHDGRERLRNRPPVGRFREFVLARKNGEKATLDLKVQGLTPFVDGARLLALAHGIEANNTLERLRQLVEKQVIERLDGAAYEEAYHFIQQTRMQQHQSRPVKTCRTPTASTRTASIIWTGASCVNPCARPSACKAAWPCGISYEPVFVAAAGQPTAVGRPATAPGKTANHWRTE